MVFGPINSRRFGMSLGIDLSVGQKCCNFDCIYCELSGAKTTDKIANEPPISQIISEVKAALHEHENIDVITLTANGEPTLYTNLKELIAQLNLIKGGAKLLILSNATGALKPEVCDALMGLDIVKFSLDSALQKTFKKIDRGQRGLMIDDIIEAIAKFRRKFKGQLVLEVLVVKGFNDTFAEFEALNLAINKIRPARVDISTIDRPPAYPVKGVDSELLHKLAEHIKNVPCVIASAKSSDKVMEFSKDEILELLARRPQSQKNVQENFSELSRRNLSELLDDGKVYETQVAGVWFYKVRI
ncbi:radical SAM protein [Campylobacter curvus]|uniref:radical SAM protein n=1 Tax=Campylobacter curvus TaxID=200 RepID=UPI0014705CEC